MILMKIIIKIHVKIYCMLGTLTASSTTGFIFSMWTASPPACWSVTSSSSSSTINHHLNLKGLQERLGRPTWVFWERKPPGIKKSLIQNYPNSLPILGRSGPRGPCLCHVCQWVQHRWGRNIKSSWRIDFYIKQSTTLQFSLCRQVWRGEEARPCLPGNTHKTPA